MIRTRHFIMLLALVAAISVNASAFPMFLEAYKSDKFTNPKNKDVVCNFCHMSPSGGDERNPFGQAFERNGEVFTPMLRAQFPDRFSYPITKVDDNLTLHFSDPDNRVVVVESNGKKVAVDASRQTVDGKPATTLSSGEVATPNTTTEVPPTQGRATTPAPNNLTTPATSSYATDPYAHEGVFFGQNVVDLPNGKPLQRGEVDFWIGHRFPEATFQSNTAPDLFGFDSEAIITFGVNVGITNHISVGAARSNYFRTIEFNTAYQLSRQGSRAPLTLQARATVEGRNNFIKDTDGDIPWIGYKPSLQLVGVRTFKDRVSVALVPTFAFHTRDNTVFQQFGASHNNTFALGVGGGIRILKTVSAVGEVTPRWGFRGDVTNRPQASFAIEKATFRHTFSLVFSDVRPMTVNRYAVGTGGSNVGLDAFGIGFNIFRRIR